MKIWVINGPNLNMLGIREPEIYGKDNYNFLVKKINDYSLEKGFSVEIFQSNHEGEIIDRIQRAYYEEVDGIVINPAGYTHTSVAILDALKAVAIKTVEVHISKVNKREKFRRKSFVSLYAEKVIKGKGLDGYIEGIDYLLKK